MFSKFKSFLLFAFSASALVGCAQPKYEKMVPGATMLNGQYAVLEKASTCPIKFKNSGHCLTWNWETQPTSSNMGSLVFKVYRGNLYDDALVSVDLDIQPQLVLWMPSMGHGSSPTSVSRLDVGTYRASNVFFVMPGAWELRFQLKDGATIVDEVIVSITI